MDQDELGDRMKDYEARETARRFLPFLPIYARIDGRGFSKFTRGMNRPFEQRMTDAMIETTKYLVAETHAKIGYTQSDEISLVWRTTEPGESLFFNGKAMKMASVLASMASAAFNRAIRGWEPYEDRFPAFDARVLQLPTDFEAANMFYWRALDARKNAVSMACRAHYSAKDMHKKGQNAMLTMLKEKGVNFAEYPTSFRHGTFVRRFTKERLLTEEELAAIPAKNRPDAAVPVVRTQVGVMETIPFNLVGNRTEVIMNGAVPVMRDGVSE